ncbi:hypothetical protein BDV12DRAFT_161368 [Aspergillus spectabilis]
MDSSSKRKLEASTAPGTSTEDKRRKVIGPSLPPPTQTNDSGNDSDSDASDDDFGPNLPPPEGSLPTPSAHSTAQSINVAKETSKEETSAPKRDAWMLAPPVAGSDRSRVDPTKLRSRKFQSGPRAGNSASSGGGIDSTWTETPEEKMRRLQDEAMGIVSSSSSAGGVSGTGADEKKAQAMREKVQRYNERVRKEEAALVDEKKKKEKEEEEDDPSKRAFDREKDMALSSKLTHAQRREMVSKAADFGSRFSKGKFL